jgi:hypothetical protein
MGLELLGTFKAKGPIPPSWASTPGALLETRPRVTAQARTPVISQIRCLFRNFIEPPSDFNFLVIVGFSKIFLQTEFVPIASFV